MRLLIVLLVILSETGISNENVSVMLTFWYSDPDSSNAMIVEADFVMLTFWYSDPWLEIYISP